MPKFTGTAHGTDPAVVAITAEDTLNGDPDALATDLETALRAVADHKGAVLSFTNVTFMASAALNAIIIWHKRLNAEGKKLVLYGVRHDGPQAVFATTKTDSFLHIVADEEAALELIG